MHWIRVDLWGHLAKQVELYVSKGMQIAVGGHLRLDRWVDRESMEQKSSVKVTADYFQVVDPKLGSLAPLKAGERLPQVSSPPTASQEGSTQRSPRSARGSGDPRGSTYTTYNMFQEQELPLEQVMAVRGFKRSTLIEHLIKEAEKGAPLDWGRLASGLQLGPAGSPWMTANEINTVVEGVLDGLAAGSPTQSWPPLESLQLRKLREALAGHPTAGPKMTSQEQLSPEDKGLTYSQLRLVLAMKKMGVDWDTVVTENPVPLPVLPLGAAPTGYSAGAVQHGGAAQPSGPVQNGGAVQYGGAVQPREGAFPHTQGRSHVGTTFAPDGNGSWNQLKQARNEPVAGWMAAPAPGHGSQAAWPHHAASPDQATFPLQAAPRHLAAAPQQAAGTNQIAEGPLPGELDGAGAAGAAPWEAQGIVRPGDRLGGEPSGSYHPDEPPF
eukprot:jgi/Botrbrau1/5642/Bobra.55_1s0030.1